MGHIPRVAVRVYVSCCLEVVSVVCIESVCRGMMPSIRKALKGAYFIVKGRYLWVLRPGYSGF